MDIVFLHVQLLKKVAEETGSITSFSYHLRFFFLNEEIEIVPLQGEQIG